MPETSTQTAGSSLEQILWRAMDRFREEPAVLDAEEFADHIARAFDADVPEERFAERFFAGTDKLHQKRHTLAEAVLQSASRRLHVYEFDLNRLEYVIVEDKDRLVVVSDFGQFQLRSDDALGRALEAAVVKAPDRRGAEPRGYFVRASGEVVGIDVKKVARTLERLMLKQVSMPAVDAPAARFAAFNPVRKALSESREQLALRQGPRFSRSLAAAPDAGSGRDRADAAHRTGLFVVMPDGSLARAEIGSATRWEQMLGQYARTAPQQVSIQAGNVVAIIGGVPQGTPGERAEARGEAIAAVRATAAPVRALARDEVGRALAGGARVVPVVTEGERFWVQPEQGLRPEVPLPEKTVVAQPMQLGEVTGDAWADWALMMGGARMRPRRAGTAEEAPLAPALLRRMRGTRALPLQIAGAPVVAFRAPDGSIIVNRDSGPVRLASVDRPEVAGALDGRVALREDLEIVPRTGAVPFTALRALELALERTAAAGGYRLPKVRIDSRPDAIDAGNALQLGPRDERRRNIRMAGPATTADRTTHVVHSMPFPNRGEIHVGGDLSQALEAWIDAPVLPAPPPILELRLRDTGAAAAPVLAASSAPEIEWRLLQEQAVQSARQGVITLELPAAQFLARSDPAISDLPFLLRRAVVENGDWTPGPGSPVPLAIRDFAFRAPFVASMEPPPPPAAHPLLRQPSLGEEEIVIPLPLWAQMGRGTISETGRIMASPSARHDRAALLGAYRLVVPGGGPIDLTGGAPAGAPGIVSISGPTGLRLERAPAGRIVAATAGGRHFVGRVPIDEGMAEPGARPRFRIGAPIAPELAAPPRPNPDATDSRAPIDPGLVVSRGSTPQALAAGPRVFDRAASQPAAARRQPAAGVAMGAATLSSPTPVQASRTVQTFRPLTTLPVQTLPTVSSSAERSRASDNDGAGDRVVSTVTYAAPVSGLEPGMWSGHRPGTTDRYRRWTYASWYEDEPQDVGGVRLSGLSRRKHPQLPVALRFRYVGAPLWWSHPAPRVVTADASAEPTRAMQAGLRAANSAAAIWRSILVAAAPVDDVTGGMDAGRERSAEKMSSLGRSLDALSTPLVSGTPPPAAATPTAPAYIAMSSAGAAGAVSSAMAARARAQAVEMSIVAAIPPAPPPLETMSTAARGAEAPHARGRGHAHEAAHGHPKEGDDAVSHSKIEGSVDAIAQRIYHRIRRRIESDRERFGG